MLLSAYFEECMDNLKSYEEDIYKCSRCALCQSVCPVYKATLNECAVSKGKFNMLNGILKGELSFSKRLKKYLDMCTGCNACKNFCPSGIDARKIFIASKSEYYANHRFSILEKFLSSYFLFSSVLLISKPCFALYRFLRLNKVVTLFFAVFEKTFLGRKILLINSLALQRFNVSNKKHKISGKNVVYFEGCFNKYINPQTEDAVRCILNKSGINLIKKKFKCCGVSYLSDGNVHEFEKIAVHNLSQLSNDDNLIITDCASCKSTLDSYKDYVTASDAINLNFETQSVSDLIRNYRFKSKNHCRIAVHIPCHEDTKFVDIVENIENAEYVKVVDEDSCCGFSGLFSVKFPEISLKISKSKAQHYLENNVDFILTTCPACILGLEQGLIETGCYSNKNRPVVMNLYVFLASYCDII